jgi:hypothetical protein
MSADLHIITFNPDTLDPALVREFATFEYDYDAKPEDIAIRIKRYNELSDKVTEANDYEPIHYVDDVWVGQVSGLKIGSTGNRNDYIPLAVESIGALYKRQGGVVYITPEIIPAITVAFSLPHISKYEQPYPDGQRSRGIAKARDVKKFLIANIGKPTFVDLW